MIIYGNILLLFMVGSMLSLVAGVVVKDILNPKITKLDKTACLLLFFIVSALGIIELFNSISFTLEKILIYPNFISSTVTVFVYLCAAIGGHLLYKEKLYK